MKAHAPRMLMPGTAPERKGEVAALVAAFLLRVPGVEVLVERVPAIARGPNGKFEFIAVEG